MSDEQEPWHLRAVVFIITRLIYFIIGSLLLPLGTRTLTDSWLLGDSFPFANGWAVLGACITVGAIGAVFGPTLYAEETTRGRGKLSEIRRSSRYGDQEEDG